MNDLPQVSQMCLMLGQNAMSPNRYSGKSQGAQPAWGSAGARQAVERAAGLRRMWVLHLGAAPGAGPSETSPYPPTNLHKTSGNTHMFCKPKGPHHTLMAFLCYVR